MADEPTLELATADGEVPLPALLAAPHLFPLFYARAGWPIPELSHSPNYQKTNV